MVTFVAECEKKSLNRTRRVLDAFANRIGSRSWQTVITNEGLHAVKKLLRKTVSKNTAVSCHWIRSRSRSELVWIVGNRKKFNSEGMVPVNYTDAVMDSFIDKQQWKTASTIQYAAAISALFHDFGKANELFQNKIDPSKKANRFEPYRHEWISLRLFQSFVGDKTDAQWLDELSQISPDSISDCFQDGVDGNLADNHPLLNLPPFAKLVAWLVLAHHKLPIYPKWKENLAPAPSLREVRGWIGKNFDAVWNSHNCKDQDQQALIEQNWKLKELPLASMQWRSQACMIASKARVKLQLWSQQEQDIDWLNDQLFTAHLSRLSLMLSDHHYSAQQQVTQEWRGPSYSAYANSDRKSKQLKQKLDEHLIGVSHHAEKIAKALPKLNGSLQQLEPNRTFTESVPKEFKDKFGWQDRATKIARSVSKESVEGGFFGVNMASTGRGKTLANAKIMAALATETGRARFSVALGLRTLTLQTGREYREQLNLTDEELSIAVGGVAVRQLFENEQNRNRRERKQSAEEQSNTDRGSESEDEFLDSELYVDYKGERYPHSLSDWTRGNERLEKLLLAPVLVSTIDHLMPATEGTKGGKQIGAMLRLLTSDLVLDEPDDFGLKDLPALCRLVHWSGMLGSRVLLSTATMPPALVYALFQAYKEGWGQYAKANIEKWSGKIVCAWFDEFTAKSDQYSDFIPFKESHKKFVEKRIKSLNKNSSPKHKGEIITIEIEENSDTNFVISSLAKVIQKSTIDLHQTHHQSSGDKRVSIGLVRMANINPLVAVAKALLELDAPENSTIHYCIYHSRYPLAIRSHLENKLDKILNRKDPTKIWDNPEIKSQLEQHSQTDHIFIVLASPVAEVGRDHDYDWAIIEPSSMRSIIQIAGRVLRHRDITPTEPNILLLNRNYSSLIGREVCFTRPGFEDKNLKLASYDLQNILEQKQYENINAIQRIIRPNNLQDKKLYLNDQKQLLNLVDLEHKALEEQLIAGEEAAKIWWREDPHWCGEVQRQQRFRDSQKDEAYYLWLTDQDSEEEWRWKNEAVYPSKFGDGTIKIIDDKISTLGNGSYFWFDLSAKTIYYELVKDLGLNIEEVSNFFGEVRLTEYNNQQSEYKYHPNFGLYQAPNN